MRRVLLLVAGLSMAYVIAANASTKTIAATATNTWDPATESVHVGDSITWTNSGGFHNVCVLKPGSSGASCDEYTNGPADSTWTSASHTFQTAGTYKFYCQVHGSPDGSGMSGTITVEPANTTTDTGTGTGTGTTPSTDTTPTQTQTQIEMNTAPADAIAPSFVGKVKRRASRKALIVQFSSSEDAALKSTVSRRAPGKHSFTRVGDASQSVKQGKNTVTLPRKAAGKLRKGAYRVKLQLVDAAGNASPVTTLNFKIA